MNVPSFRLNFAAAACAMLLAACGGNDAQPVKEESQQAQAAVATGRTSFALDLPSTQQNALATPSYHLAAVLLDEPGDADATNANTSASRSVHKQALPAALSNVGTQGMTIARLRELRRSVDEATPMASNGVSTYTPAQIRAAYGMPALPASFSNLTAAQAAQLGAGQTIYLLDAYSDANVTAELAAFNSKFGLPTCSTLKISTTTSLPLSAAATGGCAFAVVSSTSAGKISAATPSYDSGWATEIALDVEWAHATAPLARIILINTPDASTASFDGGVVLANAMGPGIVSMSFGAQEGSWTSSANTVFSGSGMTYLASAGDSGPAVNWPAVAPNVLAVGGTSLTYNSGSTRSESTWADTGGGISAYTATPSWQSSAVPGVGTLAHRSVSDVSFNANPNTGQYLAVIEPGSNSVAWASAGGTSIGAPQWAGLLAVANAMRAQSGKAALGDPHSVLYQQIGAVPGNYAANFYDVTLGSNGSCNTCNAKTGYDQVTGLGTPNVTSLLATLSGSTSSGSSGSATPSAPVLPSATVNGTAGTALSFQVSASSADTLAFSISGGPTGMSINAGTGVVSWSSPVAGSYAVKITAKDGKTGLSGSGTYTVMITAPSAPVVTSANISGIAGTALSYTVSQSDTNSVSFSLGNAPSGMTISNTGVLSWTKPVAGSYSVTVTVKDAKTGLSGKGTLIVTISAVTSGGPQIDVTSLNGSAGIPIVGAIDITDPNAASVTVSIGNAPLGMMFLPSGSMIAVMWFSPVAGNYKMTIQVTDSNGRSSEVQVPITISN